MILLRRASSPIKKGSLVLIDLWGKMTTDYGVYGDITWMAYAGARAEIPAKYTEIFEVLAQARDYGRSLSSGEYRPTAGVRV